MVLSSFHFVPHGLDFIAKVNYLIPPVIDLDRGVNPRQTHFKREFMDLSRQGIKIPCFALDEGPHVVKQVREFGFFQNLVNFGDVFADAFPFPNLGTDYDLHDSHNLLLSAISDKCQCQ
jgi:hypothetical protein